MGFVLIDTLVWKRDAYSMKMSLCLIQYMIACWFTFRFEGCVCKAIGHRLLLAYFELLFLKIEANVSESLSMK